MVEMTRQVLRGIRVTAACAMIAAMAACGGSDSPAAPSSTGSGTTGGTSSGGTGTTGGTTAPSNRTLTITIDGVPFTPLSVTAARSTPGPEIVTIAAASIGANGASSTSLGFTALAQVGVHTIAPQQFTQGTLTVTSGSTGSGFMAFQTLGRGTVTITSITATSVVGSVDLVLVPTSGATTNRAIVGTFNIAF